VVPHGSQIGSPHGLAQFLSHVKQYNRASGITGTDMHKKINMVVVSTHSGSYAELLADGRFSLDGRVVYNRFSLHLPATMQLQSHRVVCDPGLNEVTLTLHGFPYHGHGRSLTRMATEIEHTIQTELACFAGANKIVRVFPKDFMTMSLHTDADAAQYLCRTVMQLLIPMQDCLGTIKFSSHCHRVWNSDISSRFCTMQIKDIT